MRETVAEMLAEITPKKAATVVAAGTSREGGPSAYAGAERQVVGATAAGAISRGAIGLCCPA